MNKYHHTIGAPKVHCVVGGQYGSEAKGHVTAQLVDRLERWHDRVINVRVGGSNAGHSASAYTNGQIIALRTIPIGAVANPNTTLVIAAGSEIDPDVLYHEIELLDSVGIEVESRLVIDRYATIIEPRHIALEENSDLNARTGSTKKGIGAARADRIMRTATIARDYNFKWPVVLTDTQPWLQTVDAPLVIEGTQGYGLGLHTEAYPQTTSGDCRAIDLCAQAGVTPNNKRPMHVWLTMRTYPIRVAGNSGNMAGELTWEDLKLRNSAIEPEYTTVTKKMRRIAEWDADLARRAVTANGGNGDHMSIALMFTDYIDQSLAGCTQLTDISAEASAKIAEFEFDLGQQCALYGTSANTVIWTR